jgi:GNAT superfamily N-acetyltransferase
VSGAGCARRERCRYRENLNDRPRYAVPGLALQGILCVKQGGVVAAFHRQVAHTYGTLTIDQHSPTLIIDRQVAVADASDVANFKRLRLSQVLVLPPYQGLGIGKRMLQLAYEQVRN